MGRSPARPFNRAALSAAAVLLLSGCGGGSSPSPGGPPSGTPSPAPGATVVNGSERLAWNQAGDVSSLRFVAYVDGSPVALASPRCEGTTSGAECSAPLPPLTDGVHTMALAAVSGAGLESERSNSVTVQKVTGRSAVSAAAFPDARVSSREPHLEVTVTTSGGMDFAVDVVARSLKAPMQLASTPDGRLLVAEADGRVRVVRPGEPDRGEAALDARALLDPPPIGPLGLALHPEFTRNHFVYVSFLAQDGPGRTLLRVVRLREVGDALGEPAALFEAPVAVAPPTSRAGDPGETPMVAADPSHAGPRLAFGPDGLLYSLLPPGIEFHNEPAASRPRASMLRLEDNGRVPDVGPLSEVTAHPLGFAWHPSTAELWLISPGENGEAVVRSHSARTVSGVELAGLAVLRMTQDRDASSGALMFQEAQAGTLEWARGFAEGVDHGARGALRLAIPILAEGLLAGMSARIADVVAVGGGTLYLATDNAGQAGSEPGGDVVLRLRARPR